MEGPDDERLEAATRALLSSVLKLQLAERRLESRIAAQLGLSQSDVLALALVLRTSGQTIGQIASTLDLNPGSTSTLVDRLTKAGLTRRIRNPDDGRSVIIAATPLGTRTVRTISDQYADAIRAAGTAATPDCVQTTATVIAATAAHLDDHTSDLDVAS